MSKNEFVSFCLGAFFGSIILSMYLSSATTFEFCTLLAAVLAVFLAAVTYRDSRRHNRLSVMPYIVNKRYDDSIDCKCGFYIENLGAGAAIKIQYKFYWDSVLVDRRIIRYKLGELFKSKKSSLDVNDNFNVEFNALAGLSSNDKFCVYGIEVTDKNNQDYSKAVEFLSHISIEVNYESVLEDQKQLIISWCN
jgi:hypothetical protein